MKVEIVEESSISMLEYQINAILSRHYEYEIFDIKYTGNGNHSVNSRDYYSAMIIFKEE